MSVLEAHFNASGIATRSADPESLSTRARGNSLRASVADVERKHVFSRKGHFERLVETRVEGLFGLGLLGHATSSL
jgi:hypothetical protein